MIVVMVEREWHCRVCGASVSGRAEHLRTAHGIGGSGADRFGLRASARARSAAPTGRRPKRSTGSRYPNASAGEEALPPRPFELPPDAAVLRLLCASLDGVEQGALAARLSDLPGVDSVAVDLYERTVDLFLDRRRAAPPHLVALATERVELPVVGAELHRTPPSGGKLGTATLLLVVA